MAYSRKASKQDIRNLSLQTLSKESKDAPPLPTETNTAKTDAPTLHHRPLQEVRLILLCSLPLIAVLIVAWYFDTKNYWVIRFANWLTRLGT